MKSKRICLFDEIRGFAVILMVIYHTLFSMVFIFDSEKLYPLMMKIMPYEPLIPILFISICGIVCSFSRSNLKRGIRIFILAIVVTVVTYVFMPEMTIYFGILHFLGIALMIYVLTEKLTDKINKMYGMIVSVLLFVVFYNIPQRYIGILPYPYIRVPDGLYQYYWLSFIGFPSADFTSGDYFPLIPYIFLFFSGVFLGKTIKGKELPSFFYQSYLPPLDFIGRHALVIYLLHQPLIIGILYMINLNG